MQVDFNSFFKNDMYILGTDLIMMLRILQLVLLVTGCNFLHCNILTQWIYDFYMHVADVK